MAKALGASGVAHAASRSRRAGHDARPGHLACQGLLPHGQGSCNVEDALLLDLQYDPLIHHHHISSSSSSRITTTAASWHIRTRFGVSGISCLCGLRSPSARPRYPVRAMSSSLPSPMVPWSRMVRPQSNRTQQQQQQHQQHQCPMTLAFQSRSGALLAGPNMFSAAEDGASGPSGRSTMAASPSAMLSGTTQFDSGPELKACGVNSEAAPVNGSAPDAAVTGTANGSGQRRPRGRSRLETTDQTPRDRRLSQIRLAQRSYRQRKEHKLAMLESRVENVGRLNDAMSRRFGQFYEALQAERVFDAVPYAARRLHIMAEKLFALGLTAKKSGDDSSASQSSDADEELPPGRPARESMTAHPFMHEDMYHSPSLALSRQRAAMGGQVHGMSPSISYASVPYDMVTEPASESANLTFYASLDLVSYGVAEFSTKDIASSSLGASEVSFGRRLNRAILEAAFRLMMLPDPPAERYAAVFGFALFCESRDAIVRRLRHLLARCQQESLAYWKAPFGGLGSGGIPVSTRSQEPASPTDGIDKHGLSPGHHGVLEYNGAQAHEMNGFAAGSLSPDDETTRGERLDRRMRMPTPPCEGEFLDGDEVETYLGRLGILVPQRASYVKAQINMSDLDDGAAPWPPAANESRYSHQGACAESTHPEIDGVSNFVWQPSDQNSNWAPTKVAIEINVLMTVRVSLGK